MKHLLLLTKSQKIYLVLTIGLQLLFFFSIYQINNFLEIISFKKIILLIFFQSLLLLIFFSIIYKRYFSIAITFFLIILINFLTTPFYSRIPKFITLKPNIKKQIVINVNVMPGFTGVSSLTTDYKGFRTTKAIEYKSKRNDIYRVFTIGGSTTEQIYLDDKKTTSALLEKMLKEKIINKKIEVINVGVSGLRAEHHFKTFSQISKYSPDLVIFMMGINDMNKDIVSCLDNSKKIKENTMLINCPSRLSVLKISFDISESLLWKFLKNLSDYNFATLDGLKSEAVIEHDDGSYYSNQNNSLNREIKKNVEFKEVSSQYKYWVDSIIKYCHSYKEIRCLFVNQASAYKDNVSNDLKKLFWMTPPNQIYTLELKNLIQVINLYNDWLIEYSEKNKIDNCDIQNALPPSIEYFYDDNHFNEKGAKKAAQSIFKCLILIKNLN
jgi:lysophospholipase L1-like esterase